MDRLQFGETVAGRVYKDRQAAFGVVERAGRIAVAAIEVHPGDAPVFDLPGGGIDPGESETQAMIREFGEEVGLQIEAGELLVRASQTLINAEDKAVNNHGVFYAGRVVGEAPGLKIEDNHTLVWMDPDEFVRKGRHEAQVWAVIVWLRRRV